MKVDWFLQFEKIILELNKRGHIIIMGDLNADLLKPTINPGKLLMKTLKLAGTKCHCTLPTRITASSKTCLDIIAIDKTFICRSYEVGTAMSSDHLPVSATIEASAQAKLAPVVKRSYTKMNMNVVGSQIKAISLPYNGDCTVNDMVAQWTGDVVSILDVHAPMKSFPARRNRSPFLSENTRNLMKERDWLVKEIKSQSESERMADLVIRLRVVKKRIKSLIRRTMKDTGDSALATGDTKKAWQFIRTATFTGGRGCETDITSTQLNEYFCNVLQSNEQTPCNPVQSCNIEQGFQLRPVTQYEVRRALLGVRRESATGPDGIPPFLVKEFADVISQNMSLIFNLSIQSMTFPDLWKRANVAAIWKGKGAKSDPSNYRPISVLPILARCFEKLVAKQMTIFCDSNESIPPEQFGFRHSSSCEVALAAASNSWIKSVDEGCYVGALLVDLSKAFDSVNHQQLVSELHGVGYCQETMQWVRSYLSGRIQRVVQDSDISTWDGISRGVPQGSGLSPLFFNLYIRDLPRAVSTESTQFADDLTTASADKNLETVTSNLEVSYNQIKEFCSARDLMVNASKTQFILFKPPTKKSPPDCHLLLDNCVIKPETAVKLLGFHLDQHFTLSVHIEKTVKRCQGLIGMLSRASTVLPEKLLRLAYEALIRTHLEYAGIMLLMASPTQLRKLDLIQKAAVRIITSSPRLAHSAPLLAKLQMDSLENRRSQHTTNFIHKILEGKCHPAIRDLFHKIDDTSIGCNFSPKTAMGRKSIQFRGAAIYNSSLHLQQCTFGMESRGSERGPTSSETNSNSAWVGTHRITSTQYSTQSPSNDRHSSL